MNMLPIPEHRCTDKECCSFGQRTVSKSNCLCHKTAEEMLAEQRDALYGALCGLIDEIDDKGDGAIRFSPGTASEMPSLTRARDLVLNVERPA